MDASKNTTSINIIEDIVNGSILPYSYKSSIFLLKNYGKYRNFIITIWNKWKHFTFNIFLWELMEDIYIGF